MFILKERIHKALEFFIMTTVVAAMLLFTGCDDDDSVTGADEEIEVSEVVIEPQEATFAVGGQQDFSAFLVTADGDTVNDEFDIEWNWFSSDPDVFTVQNNGTATGQNPGEAFCIIEAEIEATKVAAKMRFVGRDSAVVFVF